MSQGSFWDDAEHVSTVLEYTKPLIAFGLPTLAWHVLRYRFDHITPLKAAIESWSDILATLTEEQRVQLETESPGIIARMTGNLQDLKQVLAFTVVAIKNKSYWGWVCPGTKIARQVKNAEKMFELAEGDFTRTSQRLLQDKLLRGLATPANVSELSTDIEMGGLATSTPSGTTPSTSAGTASSSANTVMAPPPRVPDDVRSAYRSGAALTGELCVQQSCEVATPARRSRLSETPVSYSCSISSLVENIHFFCSE